MPRAISPAFTLSFRIFVRSWACKKVTRPSSTSWFACKHCVLIGRYQLLEFRILIVDVIHDSPIIEEFPIKRGADVAVECLRGKQGRGNFGRPSHRAVYGEYGIKIGFGDADLFGLCGGIRVPPA